LYTHKVSNICSLPFKQSFVNQPLFSILATLARQNSEKLDKKNIIPLAFVALFVQFSSIVRG